MPPTRILFAAADPCSYDPTQTRVVDDRLGLDEDLRAIQREVRLAAYPDSLEFHPLLAARQADLLQALSTLQPRVMHFSGHAGAGGIVLVGTDGRPHSVSAATLAPLFRAAGKELRLAVLSACGTDAIAEALGAVAGIAVGVAGYWPDASAIAFNAAFYRSLASGHPVRQAFDEGVAAIVADEHDGADRPRLFTAPGVDAAATVLVTPPRAKRQGAPPRRVEQVVNVSGAENQVNVVAGDLHIGGAPPAEKVRPFTNVWYCPRRLRFFEFVDADVGTVLVHPDRVEFRGQRERFEFQRIHDVMHTRMGGDIANNWVRVMYGDPAAPREAWFSQRPRLGINPLLGGSAALFSALHERMEDEG